MDDVVLRRGAQAFAAQPPVRARHERRPVNVIRVIRVGQPYDLDARPEMIRGGQIMDYERLQKLIAYVLKAVVIYNYGKPSQLLEKVGDPEFVWLSSDKFPRPLTVAQALVGLALKTREGKSIRKKHCPKGTGTDKVFERRRTRVDPSILPVPTPSKDGRRPDTSLGHIVTDGDGHRGLGAPPRRPGYPGNRPQLCPTLPLLPCLANATVHSITKEKVHGGSHTP
jgi:hypothetical protein